MSAVGTAEFRAVMGNFCSGITVITARVGNDLVGMTCQSFFSLSLDPPLIAFSPSLTSTSYPRIRKAGRFAVNILAAHQVELSAQFARRGTDKWAGVRHRAGVTGVPVLEGSAAVVECEILDEYPAGDHRLVTAAVRALSEDRSHPPLLFFRSGYHVLKDPP